MTSITRPIWISPVSQSSLPPTATQRLAPVSKHETEFSHRQRTWSACPLYVQACLPRLKSHRAMPCPLEEASKASAVGCQETVSTRRACSPRETSGTVRFEERPARGILQIFTVWSWLPVARRPSSWGEKAKSVTREEWPSIRGTVALSGRPLVDRGNTARLREWMMSGWLRLRMRISHLEPRESQLKARKAALEAMKLPHE